MDLETRTAGRPRGLRAPLLVLLCLGLHFLPATLRGGGPLIFRDGFESCEAGNWHSATGLPSCVAALDCPAQSPGEACVSGHLFDVETSRRICTVPATATTCPGAGSGGPCALALTVYDAIDFIFNPGGALPLVPDQSSRDGCGRFLLSGFPNPPFGYAAIVTDDAGGEPNARVPTVGVTPVVSQQQVEGLPLHALFLATDSAWTASAGNPFGKDTFADRGLLLGIFLYGRTPRPGVQITFDSQVLSEDDFYFSDSLPTQRSAVNAAATSTGANGSAIVVETNDLQETSGTGGALPAGCSWRTVILGSIAGVAIVGEIGASVTAQPEVDCP